MSTAGSSTKADDGFSGDDCWTGGDVWGLLCSSAATIGISLAFNAMLRQGVHTVEQLEKDWQKGLKGRESS